MTPQNNWEEEFDNRFPAKDSTKRKYYNFQSFEPSKADFNDWDWYDSRAEIKSFIRSVEEKAREDVLKMLRDLASKCECELPGEGKSSRETFYHLTEDAFKAIQSINK